MNLLMVFSVLMWFLALVISAFVFWRRLHKELPEDYLVRLTLVAIVGTGIIGRSVWWLMRLLQGEGEWQWWWQLFRYPGIEWVGAVLIGIMIIARVETKYRHVLGEVSDAYMEAVIWGVMLGSLSGLAVDERKLEAVGRWALVLVVAGIWYWVKARYRMFSWYSSGKLGFMWWAGLFLLSGSQLVSRWWVGGGGSQLAGLVYEGLVLLISVIGIYTISGRKLSRDIRGVRKRLTRERQVIDDNK